MVGRVSSGLLLHADLVPEGLDLAREAAEVVLAGMAGVEVVGAEIMVGVFPRCSASGVTTAPR